MEKIRTGLEKQERKIVRYLLKENSPRITFETCLDLDLRLNPDKVKREIREYKKRKNNLRKTLAAIIITSSLNSNRIMTNQQYSNYEGFQEEVEIPSEPSEYVEDNYRFGDYIQNSIDEYSHEEIREIIEDYIEGLRE